MMPPDNHPAVGVEAAFELAESILLELPDGENTP